MRAVDTNLLARYYLADDAAQSKIAAAVLSGGEIFVPKTVLLELTWVLRAVAGQPADRVLAVIQHLLALPGVEIEQREQVLSAIACCRAGIEFANALHLCSSSRCDAFLTFDDRGFARKAARAELQPPVLVPKL
jgi:predicted nucleic-acid-binding protein